MVAQLIEKGVQRAAYGAAQAARIGWYSMHYVAARHIGGPLTRPGEAPYAARSGPADLKLLTRAFRQLFRDEWKMIEQGVYKLPHDMTKPPDVARMLRQSRDYIADARAVTRRAYESKGHSQVREKAADDSLYPGYYLQNFHFQTDGWLSPESASRYDMQVETLFTGAGDAMRRQALPFLHDELIALKARGIASRDVAFVDLACGTGRLLSYVVDNHPDLPTLAIDLSPDYLQEAEKRLAPWIKNASPVRFLNAKAEDLPLEDNSVDILTSVYLFHELPPRVRREVAGEIARVLRPGGLYLHVDTLQYGDAPGLDILLENFPRAVHEPYYDSYCDEDLGELFGEAGLALERDKWGFLTKVSGFRKPV